MSSSNAQGSQRMMMLLGLGCACCVCVAVMGIGAYFMLNNGGTKKPDPQPTGGSQDDVPEPAPTAGDLAGRRRVKYGAVSMVADSSLRCGSNQKVFFENSEQNDQHIWQFDPVPGKDDTYFIRNEHRSFRKGCPMYLTSPNNCTGGTVTLDKAKWADRQYWRAVPSGDGYQLQSVACANKRTHSYLTSSGDRSGKSNNPARLTNRIGTNYTIEAMESTV